MKKLIIIIFSTLLFLGCKTIKHNVRETYTEKKEVKTEIQTDIFEKENVVISEDRVIDEFENIVETITTIKLEAGETVEITTILREIVKGKKEVLKLDKEVENSSQINISESINEKIDIEKEFIDKTVSKKTMPAWLIIGSIIISIGLLFCIYIFLKKYRIL